MFKRRCAMAQLYDFCINYSSVPFIFGAAAFYTTYYFLCVAKRPKVGANATLKSFLDKYCPVINEKFWPTPWCFESRSQTILRSLLKTTPDVSYEKELLHTADGGQLAIDWVHNYESPHDSAVRPTVLILPGLTGSSNESYARHLSLQAKILGYRVVVFNYRGNGGAKLLTPRTYNATNTEDLSFVISHVKSKYPHAPLMACGISLGGLILTNYLSRAGDKCPFIAGMSVSAAWDLFESIKTLEAPVMPLLLNRHLANNLTEGLKRNMHLFQGMNQYNLEHIFKSRTIREFDDRFTSKQFGYPTYKEYYEDACIHQKVSDIKVPLLCLNAADDPFSPSHAIPVDEAAQSKCVAIVVTSHGGHIGFLEGLMPRNANYMDRVFAQYVDAIFRHKGELMENLDKSGIS